MAKPTILSVTVNGSPRTVQVTRKRKSYSVSIDGQEYNTFTLGKNSFLSAHEDFPIVVHGEQFILALRGSKMRLAKNDRYIDNGAVFVPAKPFPKWAWLFVVASGALVVFGGAIPVAFGLGGATGCIAVSRSEKSVAIRVLLCVLITAGCWITTLMISGVIGSLLN